MTVTYVSREAWGAGPHGAGSPIPNSQIVGLVAHHTVMGRNFADGNLAGVRAYMRTLQHSRPDLGDEVPYSFVVFPGDSSGDGIVAEGRGKGWTGAHTVGFNSTRFGVSYAGNASAEAITPGVIDAYNWVGARMLDSPGTAVRTFGHRDIKSTECPGNNLYARLGQIQSPFTVGDDDLNLEDINTIRDMVQNNADQVVNAVTTQIEQSEEVTRNNAEKDRRLVIDVLDGMADLLGIDPAALRAKLRAETIVVLDQVDTP